MEKANPIIREKLIKVVKNQVAENNPPEAKLTFERLRSKGISQENAYISLAQALSY